MRARKLSLEAMAYASMMLLWLGRGCSEEYGSCQKGRNIHNDGRSVGYFVHGRVRSGVKFSRFKIRGSISKRFRRHFKGWKKELGTPTGFRYPRMDPV